MHRPLPWLDENSCGFPDPATALKTPNGLLAVGGDLRPARLLSAYQRGIFPWFEADQPPLWWTPDPRMVLFPAEVHVSRSLKKFSRTTTLVLRSDQDFPAVITACAGPRRGSHGTWITAAMEAAYIELHKLGYAHSVEVWDNNRLVGGLYGLALGKVFFGESMFSLVSNASKLAFTYLARTLADAGYTLIDCQVANPHLASLGARNIAREEFMKHLPMQTAIPKPPYWPLQ